MQKYFLKTTSRSVVIEIQNLSDCNFNFEDFVIKHGNNKFLNSLPEVIQSKTCITIGHGSNGIMTGVEGWAKFSANNNNKNVLNISWMVEFFGSSSISVTIDNLSVERENLPESTSKNVMARFIIINPYVKDE